MCLAGVLVATGIALLAGHRTPTVATSDAQAADDSGAPDSTPLGLTEDGDAGITAHWVATENALPGTSKWRITGAPDR